MDITLTFDEICESQNIDHGQRFVTWEAYRVLQAKLAGAERLLKEYNYQLKKDNAVAAKIGTTIDDYFNKYNEKAEVKMHSATLKKVTKKDGSEFYAFITWEMENDPDWLKTEDVSAIEAQNYLTKLERAQ